MNISVTNMSRPSMKHSIQLKTGAPIMDLQWKAICQAALQVFRRHLAHLANPPNTDAVKCKKVFFNCHYLLEWSQACRDLEATCPLLSLCAGDWKADHTLASMLPDTHTPSAIPPSHSSTPSSLGPSRVGHSASHVTSHTIPPSSLAPSSSVAAHSHPSPCCVALKSAAASKQTLESAPMSKSQK